MVNLDPYLLVSFKDVVNKFNNLGWASGGWDVDPFVICFKVISSGDRWGGGVA